jgi:phosphoketolase
VSWPTYPWLIHRLTYRRTNHGNLHVRGFHEERGWRWRA